MRLTSLYAGPESRQARMPNMHYRALIMETRSLVLRPGGCESTISILRAACWRASLPARVSRSRVAGLLSPGVTPSKASRPVAVRPSRRIRQAGLKQVEVEADDRVHVALAAERHEVVISRVASQSAGLQRIVDVDRVATNARDVFLGLRARDVPPELGSREHTLKLPDEQRTYDDGEPVVDGGPDDEIRCGAWLGDQC